MAVLTTGHRCALAAIVLLLAGASGAGAASLEDAVKATYAYKFAPFVTWPATPNDSGPFTLCVDGADATTALLPQVTAGQQVEGHPIVVKDVSGSDSRSVCRILYIANSASVAATLAAAHGKPVLTITNGGGPEHGIVQLVVIDHHVRFDIDAKLAADAGLSISSKLLDLAHAVIPAGAERN